MKNLIAIFLLFVGFTLSAQVVPLHIGGKILGLNIDEIRTVRYSASGESVIYYGNPATTFFATETPDSIINLGCDKLFKVDAIESVNGTIEEVPVVLNRTLVKQITSNNAGNAVISYIPSPTINVTCVDNINVITALVDDCASGGGGGTTVVTGPPIQGDGSAGDPVTLADGLAPNQVMVWNGSEWAVADLDTLINIEANQGVTVNGSNVIELGNYNDGTQPVEINIDESRVVGISTAANGVAAIAFSNDHTAIPLRLLGAVDTASLNDLYNNQDHSGGASSIHVFGNEVKIKAQDGLVNRTTLSVSPLSVELFAPATSGATLLTVQKDSTTTTKKIVQTFDDPNPTVRQLVTRQWVEDNAGGSVLANQGVTLSGDTIQLGNSYDPGSFVFNKNIEGPRVVINDLGGDIYGAEVYSGLDGEDANMTIMSDSIGLDSLLRFGSTDRNYSSVYRDPNEVDISVRGDQSQGKINTHNGQIVMNISDLILDRESELNMTYDRFSISMSNEDGDDLVQMIIDTTNRLFFIGAADGAPYIVGSRSNDMEIVRPTGAELYIGDLPGRSSIYQNRESFHLLIRDDAAQSSVGIRIDTSKNLFIGSYDERGGLIESTTEEFKIKRQNDADLVISTYDFLTSITQSPTSFDVLNSNEDGSKYVRFHSDTSEYAITLESVQPGAINVVGFSPIGYGTGLVVQLDTLPLPGQILVAGNDLTFKFVSRDTMSGRNIYDTDGNILAGVNRGVNLDSTGNLFIHYPNGGSGIEVYGGIDSAGTDARVVLGSGNGDTYIDVNNENIQMGVDDSDILTLTSDSIVAYQEVVQDFDSPTPTNRQLITSKYARDTFLLQDIVTNPGGLGTVDFIQGNGRIKSFFNTDVAPIQGLFSSDGSIDIVPNPSGTVDLQVDAGSIPTVTASNGLTKTGDDIAQGGTFTNATTTLDAGTNRVNYTSTFTDGGVNSAFTFANSLNTSSLTVGLVGSATGTNASSVGVSGVHSGVGVGVYGQALSSGNGVHGASSSGFGVRAVSTSGIALNAQSTTGIGANIAVFPSSTNTVVEVTRITRNSSGAAANGIGAAIAYQMETSDASAYEAAKIAAAWTDVTTASRTGDLQFHTTNSATSAQKAVLTGAGNFGVNVTAPTDKIEVDGNVNLNTAGNKLKIATGSNASIGTATLVAGTVTVSTTAVSTGSKIFVTCNTPGGTQGFLSVPDASITNATSFVINSSSVLETSTVNWWIIN